MNRLARELMARCERGERGDAVRQLSAVGDDMARLTKETILQAALDDAVTKALGPPRGRRPGALAPWPCSRCGPRRGDQLRRNGHYRRQLVVCEGVVSLRMPQLVCVDCGHHVAFEHPLLRRRQRLWLDIEQMVVNCYLEGCGYRGTRRLVERRAGTSIGLMSTWRAFQEVARGPHRIPARPPARYLALDEVYHKVRGVGRWFLSARAVDDRGKLHWIGFVQSSDRSQQSWEAALDELGISRYNPPFAVMCDGDRAIEEAVRKCLPGVKVFRCSWHLKHNAAEWIRERFPRRVEDAGQRKGLMAAVHSIVDAPTLEQRAESLAALRRDFAWLADLLALALGRVGPKDANHPMRTNNPMERGFREQRRRTRPMDGFGSTDGATNFFACWMIRENARLNGRDYLRELIP